MGPSLDQFLEAARPHNEGVSDDALKSYWQENYGGTAPAPTRAASLPSLTRFLAEAKKANPDVPEDDLKAYWSNEYGARGAKEKDSTEWDVTRGLKVAFKQLPQLGYGLSTFAAATLESALGEGGLATAAKNWALAGYKKWGEKIEQDSKENDDFNTAYDKAKEGDLGALVDWAAYGIGYSAGQAAQILGTGGLGALAGRAVLKPATEKFVGGLVAKEVERITAANAGKAVAAEAIQKEAVGNVASQLGQWGTIGANAFGMEGGEIGGDLVQDHEGRALSGAEIARAMGATALAGGLEFAGDALGFGALTGKLTRGGAVGAMTGVGGRVARAGLAGIETGAGEAATEYGQTLAEEYGKGREDTLVPWDVNDATRRDALNSAALGAIGGHAHGIVGGALAAPRKDPVQEIIKATDVDTAVKAAIDAVHVSDVTLDSEVTGLVGRESAASRNTREEVAASEQAVRDSAFDQRDAHIAHLEAQSRELTEREKAQLEVAYASRNAEIARLIQPIAQAQAAPLIERAAGADTAVGQALAQARLPGESQQAYQARLEAQDAGTVRSDQGGGVAAGQGQGRGGADRGGNLQRAPAVGVGGDGAELRAAGGDRQRADAQKALEPAAQAGASATARPAEAPQGQPEAARATGEPAQPGSAAQQGTVSRGTPADVRVFGRPVGTLTDNALRVAATNHRMSAFREAALTEIERRKAATTTTTSRARIEGAPDVAEAGGTRLRSAAEGAQTLSNQMGEEFTPVASRSEVPITARLTANAVTKAFGKEVVFVTGGKNAAEGAMLPDDPSKIYVNVNASRKWQAVIVHETVHALKRTNAKVYAELRRAVNAALTDKAFEDIDAKYYELQDRPDIQNEELIANVAADQAHEPKFWLEVFKHTKDARALARALFSAIDKLASKLTGNGRPGYNTKEFITDHKAVRSAVAKAYAQWEKGAKEAGGDTEASRFVNKTLSVVERASAAKALGDKEWSSDTAQKFISRYAEWLQQGARDVTSVLGKLFKKVYDAAKTGALAVAVAFNFNVAQYQQPVAATFSKQTIITTIEKPKADFGGEEASAQAKLIADWMVRGKRQGNEPFIIADKPNGFMYAFDKNGVLISKSPAIFGKTKGDVLTSEQAAKSLDETTDADKITPAGIFQSKGSETYGAPSISVVGFEKTEIAIHTLYLAHPEERRAQRIQSENPEDKRISYGCINAPADFISKVIAPYFAGNSKVVIVPDMTDAAKFFNIKDKAIERTTRTETTKNESAKAAVSQDTVGKEDEALLSKPDFAKFVSKLPRTDEGEIAGSGGKSVRDVWNLVQRMERLAREGKPHAGWYKESATEILKAFKGDKRAAEIFIQLIAITSANREVKSNFTLAEKALVQFAGGEPINVGTGQMNDKINDLLYFGIPWEGRKTNNFYRNIGQQIGLPGSKETTQDMHMGVLGLGKKQLSDAEYSFMDKVTKFVASRLNMSPVETQAAIWVPQKARHTMRRYMEKGFHRGMSAQALRRMALADAAINYGTLVQKRWSMLGPEVSGFPSARETRAQGAQITAEVKPSTKLEIGQALVKLSMARLQEYQKAAFARVFKGAGPDVLMRAFDLDRTQYRIVDGAGGYDATMAPNAIVTMNTDAETTERVAKAWMYIFKQDAVPFFRTDDKLRDDPKAAQAVKIRFAESLTNTQLREVYDRLRAQVDPAIGLTKLDHNVIAIVNFRDEHGSPFVMPDEQFVEKIAEAVKANDLGAKINGYGRFGAETSYPYHDWSEDREGAGLLAAAAGGRPDLQARLRRWGNLFGQFAEGRARAAQRAAGVAERQREPAALQSKRDQAAGESHANPIATASAAVAYDRENPLKESRLGRCHELVFAKAVRDGLTHVFGVVNGFPSAPQPRAPIKIWHSLGLDPKSGNIWEPISNRWYTRAAMKAFGFEPVVSLSAAESLKLAVKTRLIPDQSVYDEHVKPLRGADKEYLEPGDYTPNWKALGKDALQSKPDLDFTEPPEEAVLGEQESDRLMELREAAIARPRRSPRVEWASRPRAGNWLSSTGEGRYSIEPEGRGFWAVSNGEQVSFENSRTDAIAVLNDRYLEDIAEGEVPDPQREKTITKQYLPSQVERVVAGMKRLAEVPGMFRLAVSEKKPLKEIFRDVDTEKLVSNVVPQGGDETGVSYAITFTNNKIAFVNEDFQNKTAYVDASHFDKGSQMGSFAYPAILNWAHNNGIKLVPDPAGLSAVNTYRRTEQMLSAALKFGSTEFMSPHPDQGLFGWNDNPENQRDNDQNIAILLLTSMNNTFSKVPAAENIHYDFEARRFEDSDNEPVDAQDFTAIARETQPRQWGIGRTTLARAIFIHSLLNQESPARAKQVKDFLDLSKPVKNLLADQPEDERLLALYSKPAYIGADAVANSAARKAGLYRPEKTMRERVKEMMPTLGKRMRQGLVDQFAPIKEVSYEAYMRARMSKGSDGALEAMFLYGKPVLEDGALNVKMGDGGLTEILQRLGGEHDRFIAWIAGNRAAQLKSEGRERLFEDDEIAWLKDLNKGEMPNGKSRAALYAEVHKEFNAYSKAVLDIAEEQGLIDAESRAVWEKDFYVPFYRNMDAQVSGPTVKSGLVSQQAFKKLKGGKEELNDLLANTLTNWSHLLSAAMKNKAALVTLEAAVTNGAAIEVPSDHIGKQMQVGKVLKALDGGAERYFMVEDPFLVDAISSLESFSFGPVGKLFETVKRWLTIGVTANPAFKIRNLIRDSISSVGVSELPYNPLANVTKAWADTAHSSQLRASLLASGGIIRFGTQLEGSRAEYVRDLIDEGVDADTILDKEHKVVSMLKLAWDRYQEFGDRGENVNRVALYKQLRSEGKSHLEASFAARDLMDFSMQGTWRAIRFLTQTVPFFNARLQGLYKGGRAAVENPQRMGYVMGGVAFASMALLLAYKDDDDWKKREEWDRDNFWWFKVGDKAFRIPKPFEIGALGTMAERALEYIVSDEMTGKRFANRMLAVVSDNLSMNPVPQIAKPLIELYANKDFFRGRPIETQGMENLSPSERIGRGTSAAAQLAGKANVLSPVQIDHVIRAYFGWLGTSATTILDYGLRPAMGLAEKPESTLKDAFLVGNFVESLPTNTSRYVTDFYDSSKVVEQAYADWRHALQTRQPERAKELREEGKDQIALHGYVTATNKQLAAYNKLEKMIEADKTMSAEQKRARLDRIDTLKNEAAKRYADLVGKRRAAEAALAK